MGQSYIRNNDDVYVAELDAGKCKTYHGFVQELISTFSILYDTDNLNDVNYYIFSTWKYEKKILFLLKNTNMLKKKVKQYNFVKETLLSWKEFFEEHEGYTILIEEE